ncbi:hypothetical protein MC885_018510 [Smutsia gigantea]|nr:hypothetical protein MC885_018510 [Smutsia gigantea]
MAGGDLRILGLGPEDCPTMQWLMRFWVLGRIHKSYHGFHPAPWHLRCQSLSGAGAPRWNDYTVPKEFNFASNVLGYWTQMEKTGGLQPGDRLALILPRVPEWWLVTMGCMRTGIIFMPGTTQLTARDILYRLQMSKAKGIVTMDTVAPEVDSVASECPALKTKLLVSDHSREGWLDFRSLVKSASPDHTCIKSHLLDPMAIFFTSGTTGLPKMAKHNHGLAFHSCFPSW